ncbi:hypothetical protein MAP00_004294 [Monascus purpureus]|nr:hypothetical protein MAP00_004294 [Monascus purpureus]
MALPHDNVTPPYNPDATKPADISTTAHTAANPGPNPTPPGPAWCRAAAGAARNLAGLLTRRVAGWIPARAGVDISCFLLRMKRRPVSAFPQGECAEGWDAGADYANSSFGILTTVSAMRISRRLMQVPPDLSPGAQYADGGRQVNAFMKTMMM